MSEAPTVRNLIRKLSRLPQDDLVVLASDTEGNKFSPIDLFVGTGYYIPRYKDEVDTYTGAVVGYDDYDNLLDDWNEAHGKDHVKVTAIILWPMQ